MMTPSRSANIMPMGAFSKAEWNRSWASLSASSACFRSVMS